MTALACAGDDLADYVPVRPKPQLEVVAERDPRALNHLCPALRPIVARVDAWARIAKLRAGPQGYPDASHYHKWAALGIAPNPGHEPPMPDREWNVDRAIGRLPEPDKTCLKRKFLDRSPIGPSWRGIPGIGSETALKRAVKRALWRVEGYLAAIEENNL